MLGLLVGADLAGGLAPRWLTVAGTGFLGAFTIFSTWMVETVRLAEEGGGAGLWGGAVNLVAPLVVGALVAGVCVAVLA